MNFDAYAERIGYRGGSTATLDVLEGIALGHAIRIPFENLDIHLGNPIDLAPEKVFDKLVNRRRGGYCFEQNTLLQEMLKTIGFTVRPLAARVLYGAPIDRPRTHMALLVDIGARSFLADVGFGVFNLLGPMPFEPGAPRDIHGESFRLNEIPWNGRALGAPPAFDLEIKEGDAWVPLYRLSLEEQRHIDFVMANHFTSTHPDSVFVRKKVVSRPEVGTRHVLVDRELEVRKNGGSEKRSLAEDDAWHTALREVFHIELGPNDLLRW